MDNGPCANGSTTDETTIFLFDLNNPPANAGPDQRTLYAEHQHEPRKEYVIMFLPSEHGRSSVGTGISLMRMTRTRW